MLNIEILCVGKMNAKWFAEGTEEYLKRLSRYAHITVTEVKDEKTPDNASSKEEQEILDTEGKRLLERIHKDDYVIVLAINGKRFSSPELSGRLEKLQTMGKSSLTMVIGGSPGLSGMVMQRADEAWSFSDLTFPHQLMRVILLEQVYRAYRIMNHEPYHK